MCIADWEVAKNLNLSKSDLLIPALSVSVADNLSLELVGAHFLTISTAQGQTSKHLVYFANKVGEFYLAKSALIDLGIIQHNFPMINKQSPRPSFNTLQHGGNADDQAHTKQSGIHEVHGEFSPVLLQSHQHDDLNDAPVRVQPGHRQVVPSPNCLPVPIAPCIPQGKTSLGSRSTRGVIMGQSELQHSVTATLNSSRVPPVRGELPLTSHKVMDTPEDHPHLSPSTICLPPGPLVSKRGAGVDPGGSLLLHPAPSAAVGELQDTTYRRGK